MWIVLSKQEKVHSAYRTHIVTAHCALSSKYPCGRAGKMLINLHMQKYRKPFWGRVYRSERTVNQYQIHEAANSSPDPFNYDTNINYRAAATKPYI